MENRITIRRRYPARALLAVAGAGLLFAFNMITGFLFIALMLPLIPVYIAILMGNATLLGSALAYAQRVSSPVPAAMLAGGRHEEKVARSRLAARAV